MEMGGLRVTLVGSEKHLGIPDKDARTDIVEKLFDQSVNNSSHQKDQLQQQRPSQPHLLPPPLRRDLNSGIFYQRLNISE